MDKKHQKCTKKGGFPPFVAPQDLKKELFFHLQVTILIAHPVPNFKSFRLLHHCVIMWYHTKRVKQTTKSKKRGLASNVQPEPDFSKTCSFRKMLGINEDCLNAKFHRNRWSRF